MSTLRWTLAGTLALIAASASAQVYECTDAQGAKQYSQQCPPGTVKERLVTKGGAGGTSSSSPAPAKSLEKQNAEFRKRQTERAEADAKQAKEQADAADAKRNCDDARGQLMGLESGQRIARIDPKTGERVFMDDDQRAIEIGRMRKSVEHWCKQ